MWSDAEYEKSLTNKENWIIREHDNDKTRHQKMAAFSKKL